MCDKILFETVHDTAETLSLLSEILKRSDVDTGHGVDHAMKVMSHGLMVVCEMKDQLTIKQQNCILLACLLHDADDAKFFKSSDYDNARSILKRIAPELEEDVIEIIKLVSCSKNGNSILPKDQEWKLYARYCDRLEAIGWIGILRCYIYNREKTTVPLYDQYTPRCSTEEELWRVATPERFAKYTGNSRTMMDHMYDKVLHIGNLNTGVNSIDNIAKKRNQIIIEFVLEFGRTGAIDIEQLEQMRNQNIVL